MTIEEELTVARAQVEADRETLQSHATIIRDLNALVHRLREALVLAWKMSGDDDETIAEQMNALLSSASPEYMPTVDPHCVLCNLKPGGWPPEGPLCDFHRDRR